MKKETIVSRSLLILIIFSWDNKRMGRARLFYSCKSSSIRPY